MQMKLAVTTMLVIAAACDGDPHIAPPDGSTTDGSMTDSSMTDAMTDGSMTDGSMTCSARNPAEVPSHSASCMPAATDFSQCSSDMYAACISDRGEYVRIRDNISTIGRVAAYEMIEAMLFTPSADASAEAYVNARGIYQADEGLDSRIARRFDVRYTPEGTAPNCTTGGVPAMHPQYCVGPAVLQPTLLTAMRCGAGTPIEGDTCPAEPRINAARIEGALQWFLYISTIKESLSCTTAIGDCDSSYAYYTGGETNRGGVGLAAEVSASNAYAHDRIWDGILALRCWRDLDSADTATMLDVRDRARNQLVTALDVGYASVLADVMNEAVTATGTERLYHWEKARVMARALDLPFRAKSASGATQLATLIANESFDPVGAMTAISNLRAAFDCP